MKPYAYQGTGHNKHPHNVCSVCSGQPRSKKTTRQHSKKEIDKEYKGYLYLYEDNMHDSILSNLRNSSLAEIITAFKENKVPEGYCLVYVNDKYHILEYTKVCWMEESDIDFIESEYYPEGIESGFYLSAFSFEPLFTDYYGDERGGDPYINIDPVKDRIKI